MRKFFTCFLFAIVIVSCKKSITNPPQPPAVEDTSLLKNYNKDLTIVNWNIEWFGAPEFGGDLQVQENNAGKILKYLNADLYGICEVVDTARFGRMIRLVLGDEFRYVVAPYSNISQKPAFIYNRNIFRNVVARPFMGLSSTAFISFASGRFPFLMSADVVVNAQKTRMTFILIHAKANADLDGYTKRLNSAIELKDSLDSYFSEKYFMLIGDYNDNFNGSILQGKVSPYQNFLNDSTHYHAITLPLNATGYQSTLAYANSVIDQQIISNTINKWYVSGSARIRTDVTAVVPDYKTRNTSDHYPLSSIFSVVY